LDSNFSIVKNSDSDSDSEHSDEHYAHKLDAFLNYACPSPTRSTDTESISDSDSDLSVEINDKFHHTAPFLTDKRKIGSWTLSVPKEENSTEKRDPCMSSFLHRKNLASTCLHTWQLILAEKNFSSQMQFSLQESSGNLHLRTETLSSWERQSIPES
jgi:hypothetical protein